MGHWRPKTRKDCEQGARPCPFVGCKHSLVMEVVGSSLKHVGVRDRDQESRTLSQRASLQRVDSWSDALIAALGAMPETCALDVADSDGATQQEVAEILNLSTERVSQIEKDGLRKLRLWKECA